MVTIGRIETAPSPKVLTTIGGAAPNGTAKKEEKELAGVSGD